MRRIALGALMALVTIVVVPTPRDLGAALHFGLRTSQPTADSSVPSPESVELWFTQVPQDNSVRARILDGAGELVPASRAAQDAEDETHFSVAPEAPLAAGAYRVAWRGIGQDGHPVDGDFTFTVVTSR